jgi:hypothetical protein
MYGATTGSGLDQFLDLTVTRGTIGAGNVGDCSTFVADTADFYALGAGRVFNGTVQGYPDDYAAGRDDRHNASNVEAWTQGEAHGYKFTATLQNDDGAQGKTATQVFSWQAQPLTAYSEIVMSDDPASYWKLDETGAAPNAADATGLAAGTYVGSPTLGVTSGLKEANTAVSFDGVDDKVNGGDVHDYAGTSAFSVEFWANPTAANTAFRRVVTKERFVSNGDHGGWIVALTPSTDSIPNRIDFGRFDGGAGKAETYGTAALQAGTWYHVVCTYNSTVMRVYVNGTEQASTNTTLAVEDHTSGMRLGIRPSGGEFYGGLLDEVAIYGSALTPTQITAHYEAGRR